MSILDDLLGGGSGSSNSTDLNAAVGANPALDLNASDVLHSDALGLTGIGDLGIGLSAPTVVGVSASSDTSSDTTVASGHGGGLLGGLL
jgi:hypothetical protein